MQTADVTIFPDSDDEKLIKNVKFEYDKTSDFMCYNADEIPGISYLNIHSFDGKLTDLEFAEMTKVLREMIEEEFEDQ